MSDFDLSGCRVLIVEDEHFLADDTARVLGDAGATVIGPVGTLENAKAQAARSGFDVALIDIKLNNELAYPVADMLRDEGVPFAFVTGYGEASIPARFVGVAHCEKPYGRAELLSLVTRLRLEAAAPVRA